MMPTVYMMLPGMMNNGGHKVGAQWVRLLLDHGYKAVFANTHGEPCSDFWNFTVPVCSFADVPDTPDSIVVWNWGPDLLKRQFQYAKQYYFAQDCCQPHYPGNDQYMPLLSKLPLIAVGQHCSWFYQYTQNMKVAGIVYNYVDTDIFKSSLDKFADSRRNNVCMMQHREHWSDELAKEIVKSGFNLVVAKGNQRDVVQAMHDSAYFVSAAPGQYTPWGLVEGFPLPTAEACASGCIVVAVNNRGNTEYIMDGLNGFFYNDGLEALGILLTLSKMPVSTLQTVGAAAAHTFRSKFSDNRTRSQIIKVLKLGNEG